MTTTEAVLAIGDAIWDGRVYVVVGLIAWVALGTAFYGVPFKQHRGGTER
jgi:hypothetical protein